MKDRLIELLGAFLVWHTTLKERWFPSAIERLADHILSDGWTRLPCKVGDTFWGLQETQCFAYEVLGFKYGLLRAPGEKGWLILTTYEMEFIWGIDAFATEEEAEKALKERSKDNESQPNARGKS